MSRYIDRDKFIGNIKTDHWGVTNMVEVGIALDKSVADVVEVRRGHWEKTFAYSYNWDDFHNLKCSECGISIGETALKEKDYKYCPKCGAKMDGERREE